MLILIFNPRPKPVAKEKKRPIPLRRTALKKNPAYEIPQQSPKMKSILSRYRPKAKKFKIDNPVCKITMPHQCTYNTTEVHHTKGKATEELWLDERYWLPACHNGHTEATEHSAQAIACGSSVSRNHRTKNH